MIFMDADYGDLMSSVIFVDNDFTDSIRDKRKDPSKFAVAAAPVVLLRLHLHLLPRKKNVEPAEESDEDEDMTFGSFD
ncbi:hypothetical protein COCNU_16G001350 [Cocos nucifera]|uniref:Uncharacterized protein n=1 Tax=Cocos nucifera TaxID=13894 RepID=A0A8K0IXN7_COCNU|nr:hypothetical protein COCNU_16G001350 [Cocos nucifera]